MKQISFFALSMIGLAVAAGLSGATALDRKPQLGISAGDVSEIRGTATHGECWVYLNLTGDAAADAHSVRRIRVNRAQDELGRDLMKYTEMLSGVVPMQSPASQEALEEQRRLEAVAAEVARRRSLREAATGVTSSGGFAPAFSRPARPVIVLRNPSRHSPTIKLIEAEIELFFPTEANGGIVRLKNFATHPGEPLQHAALEAQKLQVVYFTRETFESKGKLIGSKAQEAYAAGFRSLGGKAVGFIVFDPKKLVVDLEVQGSDGKPIAMNPYSGGNVEWSRGLLAREPLPGDAQLIVRIATSGAIQSYPFKLENVPLP